MCALPVLTSALPPSGRAAVPCSGPAYIIGMSIVCFPAVQMVLRMALIIGSGPTARLSTRLVSEVNFRDGAY